MGLADVARDKAAKELAKAQTDIVDLTAELVKAQTQLAAAQQADQDKVKAQASEAESKIADLKLQLTDAQTQLTTSEATKKLTDTLTSPGFVKGMTESFRQSADASKAKDQAHVDRITAEISDAQTQLTPPPTAPSADVAAAQNQVDKINASIAAAQVRLKVSEKALSAIDSVSDPS